MATKTIHSSDSKSLWNFTLSPGWTVAESEVLRVALMKFGIGNWKTITSEKVLPGKTVAQLVCQTQRMLGQQSLKEFNGLKLDPVKVFERNKAKVGPEFMRKNGILINGGDNPNAEVMAAKIRENKELYGLAEDEIAKIVIPSLKEADTSCLVVDSAVKTAASIRNAKLYRLSKLYARLEELQQRKAALERGEVFVPEPPAATPTGKRSTSSTGKAADSTSRKGGKKGGKAKAAGGAGGEPKKRGRRAADSDDDIEDDTDDDFVAAPPKLSTRGRVLKKPQALYASGSKKPRDTPSFDAFADDDLELALALSMQ